MKDKNRTFWKKTGDFLSGRGFYIALAACVLVIGVSAWALFFAGGTDDGTDVGVIDSVINGGNSMAVQPNDTETVNPSDNTDKDGSATDQENITPETPEEPETDTAQEPEADNTMAPIDVTDVGVYEETSAKTFMWPVYGDIVKGFYKDELVYSKTMMDWRTHSGLDISAEIGAKVMAVADGTVYEIYEDDLLGTTVIVDHGDGLMSVYANLAETPTVAAGDAVKCGDVIGAVGNTAIGETAEVAHLHFEMRNADGTVDPNEYLPAQ